MSEARLPVTYREHHGCHNCRYAFRYKEFEESTTYFCTRNAPPRPKCGSVLMGECSALDDADEFEKQMNAWDEWSEGRQVEPWGLCDIWEGQRT